MDSRTDDVIAAARELLAVDHKYPVCGDSQEIHAAMTAVRKLGNEEIWCELIDAGFLRNADERFHEHVGPRLCSVPECDFVMGTAEGRVRHFYGETPCHGVRLPAFGIARTATTNGLFALYDPTRANVGPADRDKPAVDVTWFDAAVFAAWMGCRLPTEAEWEYACGAGTDLEWCCEEADLPRHAWYSEISGDKLHDAGIKEPNALGLYDMHGNVWEWCRDAYAADFYGRSPAADPVAEPPIPVPSLADVHRVCRGGGYLALAEMCRIRYRLHDPASYSAFDLGFRLAVD